MQTKPILVIGARGKTGSRVANRLDRMGAPVRRGSRTSAIPFDWEKPDTWEAALDGTSGVYITYFPDLAVPGAVDRVEDLCMAAKSAGTERIVLLSGRGEYHAKQGEEVVRNSGIEFTLVRAAWFAQNFSEGYLRDPILSGALPMPGGDVREPIIDIDDIADVVVAALTETRHAGELYEVTGPELLTFADMAEILSKCLNRKIQHIPIGFDAFHAAVADMAGDALADIFTTIARETLDGRNASLTDGVERALGRKPRSFTLFAQTAARDGAWHNAA